MDNQARWKLRFSSFKKANKQLQAAIHFLKSHEQDANFPYEATLGYEMQKEGLIQRFEYTHELAWKVLKDFLNDQGNNSIMGSKDATREAFKLELIEDGEVWMDMIQSRNITSHNYDEIHFDEVYNKIIETYGPAFEQLRVVLQERL